MSLGTGCILKWAQRAEGERLNEEKTHLISGAEKSKDNDVFWNIVLYPVLFISYASPTSMANRER